jgi:hypothetical protein
VHHDGRARRRHWHQVAGDVETVDDQPAHATTGSALLVHSEVGEAI